jgi:type II secretory pathway pseudopilin PulG
MSIRRVNFPLRSGGAFTLVEVLASLAFLGLVIPVVISALLLSSRAGVISERSAIAAELGENQLNTLLLGGAWSSSASAGNFGTDWPDYRWELEKADWENGSMTELRMRVFFTVQGKEHSVLISTLDSQSLTQQSTSQ